MSTIIPSSLIILSWISCNSMLMAAQNAPDPVVYTPQLGYLEGFHYKTENDFGVNIFLGIPYAQPPVGELRFEKPRRIANQSKTPINAKKYGASCYPHHRDALMPNTEHSEDCLFLNVLTPAERNLSGYPVLVFIHGGGFQLGSSSMFDHKAISENFVSRGVVYVSINYRLGFLGFLSDGGDHLRGNLGLWDQTMALHFIHDNIAAFNGDPKQVTIMGHSAGAMSVSALTFSAHSNTLFQRAVSLSGAALDGVAFTERTVNDGIELIEALGCKLDEPKRRMICLKGRTVDEFMDAVHRIGCSRQSLFVVRFHPRIDGDFIMESLDAMLRKAPRIPSILGTANMETALPLVIETITPQLWNMSIPQSQFDTFSESDFMRYVNDIVATEADYGKYASQLRVLLTAFYLRDDSSSVHAKDANFYIERLVEMTSDMQFNIPLYIEAKEKMSHGWPVYLLEQEYANPMLHSHRPVKGAYHANEYPYLFNLHVLNEFEFTDDDRAFQNLFLETISNFIKTGSPSTDKYHWEKLDAAHSSRYYSFTPKPTMKPFYRRDSVRFWTKEIPKEILAKLVIFNLEPALEFEEHEEL